MKKRFSLVVVLALAMVMLLAGTAMAAAPAGTVVSNDLEAIISAYNAPTITVNNDFSPVSQAGTFDYFSVSTTTGDFDGTPVRVKICADAPEDAFDLYYLETDPAVAGYNTYLPLSFDNDGEAWFGPAAGFPLSAATSNFRVEWNTAGTYNFTLTIESMDPESELSPVSVEQPVTVTEAKAINMSWTIGGNTVDSATPINVKPGTTFNAAVTSALADGVTSVDNTLFVIEVTKDGSAASAGDFEITKVNDNEDTEGINNTFTVEAIGDSEVLQGYWGPVTGFTFNSDTTSTFTAKFNNTGTYNVKIYAIQVGLE